MQAEHEKNDALLDQDLVQIAVQNAKNQIVYDSKSLIQLNGDGDAEATAKLAD